MRELTDKTFYDFVKSHPLAVVLFWAQWSVSDVRLKHLLASPDFQGLREQIAFAAITLDANEHEAIWLAHEIRTTAVLVFYRYGEWVDSAAIGHWLPSEMAIRAGVALQNFLTDSLPFTDHHIY